jgi:hypothetical protein
MPRLGNAVSLAPHQPKPKKGSVTLPYTSTLFEDNAAPAGTYNPQVQQEVERGREGLNDLLEKLETEARRGNQDAAQRARELARTYNLHAGDVRRNQTQNEDDNRRALGYDENDLGYKLGQLGINFSRSIEDLSTAKQRGQQDYERTLTNMQHEYGARAEQQSQNAIQQGTDEAGTNTASAAVRGANQTFDKGNVDLSHNRSEEDFATRQNRLGQDYESDVARANEGFGRQREGIDLSNARGAENATRDINRSFAELRKGLNANELDRTRHAQDRANESSHAERTQTNYESHAAENSIYEANKLHPNLHFPGSTPPGSPTGAPHAYALAPAVAVTHAPSFNGGTSGYLGGRRGRLGFPRY